MCLPISVQDIAIEGLKETKNDGFEGLEWKNEKNLM